MQTPSLYWLPVSLGVLTIATFILTYILAVINGHVWPLFPYISDTGTTVPESCVFGLGLSIAALLALCTTYVRYKLVEAFEAGDRWVDRLNFAAFILGCSSTLGLVLVANFQETSVETVHLIGAGLVFGCGVVYCFLHTAISYRMHPTYNGLYICQLRLTLSLVSTIALVIVAISGAISRYQYTTGDHPDSRPDWQPKDSGYPWHITSTVSEWVMGVAFQLFFVTFARDFRKMTLRVNSQLLVSHLDEDPVWVDRESGRAVPGPSESSCLIIKV